MRLNVKSYTGGLKVVFLLQFEPNKATVLSCCLLQKMPYRLIAYLFKWESSFSNKLDGTLSLWSGPQINTYMSSVTLEISSLMVYFLVQFELNKATEPVCCKQCHVMERDRNWPHLTITFFKWESRFFCFTSLVAHSCPVL